MANFLNGDGLVFNIGERVEGFTNFGWVIYLIFWGKLGVNYVLVSKITGFLLGIGVIIITFLIARKLFPQKDALIPVLLTTYLVAVNQSFAYWSIAGLETAAFAFLTLWSIYLFLNRSNLLILSLLLAVFIRPEGALITGMLILIELIVEKKTPYYTLRCAFIAFLLSLPYVGFKLFYYGSILPNPFYAKTGLSMTQLLNGMEYSNRFLKHYGFYGIPILIPILFYKKISKGVLSIWLFSFIYLLYVILVGGDVLKVHRFFLPVIGLYAFLAVYSINLFVQTLSNKSKQTILVAVGIGLLGLTYYLPNKFVKDYNRLERVFVEKMSFMAKNIAINDNSNFSVALPTIGIFGYELIGHKIIDMVGLTDSTIARHSEEPIPGMISTWKEGKHNSAYILSESPDYIMFSTGVKPSAPAEKALMLYPRFLQSYGLIGWYYHPPILPKGNVQMIFKKKEQLIGEIKPVYPLSFVENYKKGLDAYSSGDQKTAIRYYNAAIKASPKPVYNYLLYQRAFSHYLLREHQTAITLYDSLILIDSTIFMAHKEMYLYASLMRDNQKAAIHKKWLLELVPWYFPRIDSTVTRMVKKSQESMR